MDDKYLYEYVPKLVERSHVGKVTKLWNQQTLTDVSIPNNKLDITIRENE
jgi:hypothetical protein